MEISLAKTKMPLHPVVALGKMAFSTVKLPFVISLQHPSCEYPETPDNKRFEDNHFY